MKAKLIFEPNLIPEVMGEFQDCPLRSVRNQLGTSRQQYHSTAQCRDACIGFGAAVNPAEGKSALKAGC